MMRTLRRMNAETRLTNVITDTFNMLARQRDLSPRNPKVTQALSRLVTEIVEAEEKDMDRARVLEHPVVKAVRPHLLTLLSRAEYEMEMYFSTMLGAEEKLAMADLSRFWYRDNYRDLIAQEIRGLAAHTDIEAFKRDPRPAVFVGAGPLPLSAVDLYQQLGKKCVCVEIDDAAAAAGQRLVEKLGLGHAITYVRADGRDVNYADYSLIMVASLVAKKADVFSRIRDTAPDAVVAVRSADGLKTMLYEPVDIAEIETQGFAYYGTAPADKRTVNSTCYFGRAPKPPGA